MVIVLSLLLVSAACAEHFASNSTVKDFIEHRKDVTDTIVLFVNTKFPRSRKFLESKFPEISQRLRKDFPHLKQVIVDRQNLGMATKKDLLYDHFNVYYYPAISLFMHGVRIPLFGAYTADLLSRVIGQRLTTFPIDVATVHGLQNIDNSKLLVAYYTTDPYVDKVMRGLSFRFSKFVFAKMQRPELAQEFATAYGVQLHSFQNTVVLSRRPSDQLVRQMKDIEHPRLLELIRFVIFSSRITTSFFDNNTIGRMNSFGKAVLLYALDPKVNTEEMKLATRVAEKHYNKVMTVFIEPSNMAGLEFLASVGFPVSFPQAYLITKKFNGKYRKFILRSKKVSYFTLTQFVDECVDNIYPKHYRSEEPPSADLFNHIKTLVGKTIDQAVFKEKDHYHIVFLFNAKTSAGIPKFQQLAEKFQHEKVKFYIFDADKNESRFVAARHEGKILLFHKKRHLRKTFKVDKNPSLKGIREFLQKALKRDKELTPVVTSETWLTDL